MREARLVFEYEGHTRKLCKIFFTKCDSSIYVQPYWPGNIYYSGAKLFVPDQRTNTFTFTDGYRTSECPKLSYHESGQVHLKCGKENIAEVVADPIGSIRGEEAHVLTLLIGDLGKLPVLTTRLRWKKAERDFKCIADNPGRSVKVLVYALSGKADHLDGCPLSFHLKRKSASQITTFGVRVVVQKPVGEGQLVMLSGWAQDAANVNNQSEFIYMVSNP